MASKDRDIADQRIISDFSNRKGQFVNSQEEAGGYPTAKPAYRPLKVPSFNIDEWLQSFAAELEQ